MAVSVAVSRVIKKQGGFALADKIQHVAGHSLGEYSALTAAGTFSLSDAARLLRLRGEAMQRAVPVGIGAMAAILGLSFDDVKSVAEQASTPDNMCSIANDNCEGQVVISGHKDAVERAAELAKDKGAKRAVILPVSAPFHCPLMAPAAQEMAEALAGASMQAPSVPVVCNVSVKAETDVETIRKLLIEQVTGMVRWRESVLWMRDKGVESMAEIGAGKVLCGLSRRIDRDIKTMAVETPEQIEALLETL